MAVDLIGQKIIEESAKLFERLADLPDDDRIDVINEIRLRLREHSPMKREPVDCVLWVRQDNVHGNSYNPNVVAPPEMNLLKLSIMQDGYTQPIVTWPDTPGSYEVVDGFHRNRVAREVGAVQKRVRGRLPITVINTERTAKEDRMAATIRHNRARGVHTVDAMSEIVLDLARRNWADEKIGKELGMEPDEVLRLRQVSGLADLFGDREFSQAWEAAATADGNATRALGPWATAADDELPGQPATALPPLTHDDPVIRDMAEADRATKLAALERFIRQQVARLYPDSPVEVIDEAADLYREVAVREVDARFWLGVVGPERLAGQVRGAFTDDDRDCLRAIAGPG